MRAPSWRPVPEDRATDLAVRRIACGLGSREEWRIACMAAARARGLTPAEALRVAFPADFVGGP